MPQQGARGVQAAEVRQLERIFTERMRRTQESVMGGCAKRR